MLTEVAMLVLLVWFVWELSCRLGGKPKRTFRNSERTQPEPQREVNEEVRGYIANRVERKFDKSAHR